MDISLQPRMSFWKILEFFWALPSLALSSFELSVKSHNKDLCLFIELHLLSYCNAIAAAATGPVITDTVLPDLECPPSLVVTLSGTTRRLTLEGAVASDNVGLRILEYKPYISDKSATFEPPFDLILTRESVGRTYSVRVRVADYNDNEATCNYAIVVEGLFLVFPVWHGFRSPTTASKIVAWSVWGQIDVCS